MDNAAGDNREPPGMTTRRQFIRNGSGVLLGVAGVTGAGSALAAETDAAPKEEKTPALRIGLFADAHYADRDPAGTRFYRESAAKMREVVGVFRKEKVDFVVELGDLIDSAPDVEAEIGYLRTIEKVFAGAAKERHYVFGNHCISALTKAEFLANSGARKGYYAFDHGGFHFVILDACFRSDMKPYGRENAKWTDTNIPLLEREWLQSDLAKTEGKTIVFAHQRLDQEPDSPYSVKQSPEVRGILENSGRVAVVFQGHSHENELNTVGGIHYCTLCAMIEGSGEENNAYGVLEIFADGTMALRGFRRQKSYRF